MYRFDSQPAAARYTSPGGWPMQAAYCWKLSLTAILSLALNACSSLPTLTTDMAHPDAPPVQLDGPQGPLSAARSKAILDRLQARGAETNIFNLHLAVEEAIVGSPLTRSEERRVGEEGRDRGA